MIRQYVKKVPIVSETNILGKQPNDAILAAKSYRADGKEGWLCKMK
jgi:hypothetical protein